MKPYQCCSILSILSLFLLTIGLLVAWHTPCTGYEPNIYSATPLIFWIGVFACYLTGIGTILLSQFYRPLPKRTTAIAYILMILAFVSLIFLTVLRGYMILNVSGDGGSHIGSLAQTVLTGQVPYTYYPGIYIEPAFFQILTGLDGQTVLSIFPMLILGLFTLGMHILAKRIFPHKGEVCLATIIALLTPIGSTTIFGTSVLLYSGMTIANVGLLVLYVYLILSICQDKNHKLFLPLILLTISITLYHPYVSVITFVVSAAVILCSILPHFLGCLSSKRSLQLLVLQFVIAVGMFFVWVWSFFGHTIISGIRSIFEAASVEDRGLKNTADILNSALDYGYGIDTVIQIAGINLFMYGMCVVAGIIFIRKFWNDERYFLMKILFACAACIGGMIVVSMLGDFVGGWGRFLKLIYITSLLSTGFVLYHFLSWMTQEFTRVSFAKLGVVFIILAMVCFASVMTFHPSPHTYNMGYQTTQTEFTAAETLLPRIDISNNQTGIYFIGIQRYINAIYGSASVSGSYAYGDDLLMVDTGHTGTDYAASVPFHFGYDTGITSLASLYEKGDLIYIKELDIKYYQEYYPELIPYRWTDRDWNQFEMDDGLQYVYDSGGVEMRLV